MTKQRPILFNAPMVRALLDGSKTKTRRIAKLTDAAHVKEVGGHRRWHPACPDAVAASPCGQVGDQLWVREAWCDVYGSGGNERRRKKEVMFRADGETDPNVVPRWTPSIHMPRWASRITLEITSVRVERLQDISEADALAEGCTKNHNGYFWGGPHAVSGLKQMATATTAYRDLWKSINGAGSWDLNPWVWVIEFKKIPQ